MQVRIRVPDAETVARDARIRALYVDGASIDQIAHALGIHRTTAWRVLNRAGVVRPRGWRERLEQLASK